MSKKPTSFQINLPLVIYKQNLEPEILNEAPDLANLLQGLLCYFAKDRMDFEDFLNHSFFEQENRKHPNFDTSSILNSICLHQLSINNFNL